MAARGDRRAGMLAVIAAEIGGFAIEAWGVVRAAAEKQRSQEKEAGKAEHFFEKAREVSGGSASVKGPAFRASGVAGRSIQYSDLSALVRMRN